jgi:ABC-type antimicrobial peptide transport system permease subunit
MIALSFLLESGFIAIGGIGLGLILGITFSWSVISSGGIPGTEGAGFIVPWRYLIVISVIAFSASLIMTYFPARQASKVEVAEALRYE